MVKADPVEPTQSSERFIEGIGLLFLLTSIFFVNFTARIVLSPLLPVVEKDLVLSHAQAGSLFFIISLGYFISLIGSSFFSSRFCHRNTIMISCAASSVALIGVSISSGILGMRLALFFVGLGAGLYLPSAIVMITTEFDSKHWGKALAFHELAPNLGFVAAPFITEAVMRYFPWRVVFLLLGIVALLQVILFLKFARGADFCGKPPDMVAFRSIFSNPVFALMILLFGLGITGTLGLFTMLPIFLVSAHDFERGLANMLVALSRVAGAVVVFGGGWLTDRLGAKRVLAMVFLISGALTLSIALAPTRFVAFPIFIQPIIAVCFFPAGFAILSQVSRPDTRNLMVSLTVPLAFLTGAGAIPALIGVLGEHQSFQIAFGAVGVFIATGTFFSFLIPKDNPIKPS